MKYTNSTIKDGFRLNVMPFFLFTLAAFTPVLGVFSHTSLQQQQQKTEKVKKPNITRRGRVQEFL